ncbi:hypothetical protein KP79_PYT17682 [Mizuhopecten yessoensis]|uniref:Methyltransferase FkbM domain-containing protein n=1 Tax=Mizuhopecten yessoensis TaxID=6573 RepID=A0A210QD52_MIZYE|nr:hypothetical protein KP79_PYT17682 [Mizuhopecten yessoensis]
MRRSPLLVTVACTLSFVFLLYNLLGQYHSNGKQTIVLTTHSRSVSGSDTRQLVRKSCSTNQTYIDFGAILTQEQTERVEECMVYYIQDGPKGLQKDRTNKNVRYTSHTYLNNSSFVIEAGGYLGYDVSELNSRYHPSVYVVLEPVVKFFKTLQEKFKDSPNIVLYNFGVDVSDGVFFGSKGTDGTSIYKEGSSDVKLQIIAVPKLLEKLKVAEKKVDLVTLNCEGREYAFLDFLLSTDYIHQFRNIQYQAHRVPSVCHPVKRFCWYQELLAKTHNLIYQHKFWWESWTHK